MKYQATHGARALSIRLFATRPPTRIADRQRRALARIQHALTAAPIEHLHALTVGRLARWELILQGYEAWCLAHPEEPAPKHMLAVANAWRRTGEFLALLSEQLDNGERVPDLASYLATRTGHTAAPAAASEPAVTQEPSE